MSKSPRYVNKSDRMITPGATAVEIRHDFACAPMDRAARALDEKYGIDRLIGLVSPLTAERYGRAIAHLLAAMDGDDPAATAAAAVNCVRGLTAMDAEATAAGHLPADPKVWQIEIDGKRYGICQDASLQSIAEREYPGLEIITMRQAIISRFPDRFGMPAAVIAAFPGAKIVERQYAPVYDDDGRADFIPF